MPEQSKNDNRRQGNRGDGGGCSCSCCCYGGGALALEGFRVNVHGVYLTPPAKYKNVNQMFFDLSVAEKIHNIEEGRTYKSLKDH